LRPAVTMRKRPTYGWACPPTREQKRAYATNLGDRNGQNATAVVTEVRKKRNEDPKIIIEPASRRNSKAVRAGNPGQKTRKRPRPGKEGTRKLQKKKRYQRTEVPLRLPQSRQGCKVEEGKGGLGATVRL